MATANFITYNAALEDYTNTQRFHQAFMKAHEGTLAEHEIEDLHKKLASFSSGELLFETTILNNEENSVIFIDFQSMNGPDILQFPLFLNVFGEAFFEGDGSLTKAKVIAEYHTALHARADQEDDLDFERGRSESEMVVKLVDELYQIGQAIYDDPVRAAERFTRIVAGKGPFQGIYALFYNPRLV